MKLLSYIWLSIFLSLVFQSKGQSVKVVTKITERTYQFNKECLLEISAEKANISIKPSNSNEIKLTLKQEVKNRDERIAKREMEGHRFIENKERHRLYLRNHILFESGNASKSSIFKTEYILEIPSYCHVKITNQLGNTVINNAEQSITCDIKYGTLTLNNCVSHLNLKHTLGEISIVKGIIDGTCQTNNTNVKLQSVGGVLRTESTMGTINAYISNNNLDLDILAKNCETTLINRGDQNYKLDFLVKKGTINIPEFPDKSQTISIDKDESTFSFTPKHVKGRLKVEAELCNLNYF